MPITLSPYNIVESNACVPSFLRSEEEEFPYIIPRISKIENGANEQESIIILEVHFGVYDPGTYDGNGVLIDDGSGYRDFWNLVETTRQAFFMHQTIDRKARLITNFFEAEPLGEQIYPYWEGWCKTKWHVIFPQPNLDPKLL